MKRGFLNQPKAKKLFDAIPKGESKSSSNQNAGGTTTKPADSPIEPPTLNLHEVPKSLGKNRSIFRYWPRNPDGPVIHKETAAKGKQTSNGIPLWGKTLYDIYYFERVPTVEGYLTISTGSRLAAHMRSIGELDWATDEISWADQEGDPVEVPPCDIGSLIEDSEWRTAMGLSGTSMPQDKEQQMGCDAKPSHRSVFDPSNYPLPWPLVPFSAYTPTLQKRIPFHLLPQKLIVHDPWNLLSARFERRDGDYDWTKKDDIVRIYKLRLSAAGKETMVREQQIHDDETTNSTFILTPEDKSLAATSPPIKVSTPPSPPPPSSIPESHLYISPAHRCGHGNHSIVYQAEWELPRSLLVRDKICHSCVMEKVKEEIRHREPPETPSLATIHTPAATIELVNTTDIPMDNHADTNMESREPGSCGGGLKTDKKAEGRARSTPPSEIFTIKPAQTEQILNDKGPWQHVYADVKWQNPEREPYCSHVQASKRCKNVPLTAKVRVAAKLSFQYDRHLRREAENYQSFPSHFFETCDGYNVIPPLHHPVPVNALAPQFYGYYLPEENQKDELTQYLSPILLLEDCGVQIEPEELDLDDRRECASLLYRFNLAGWTHGSFASRNILMQDGPLSEWPAFRGLTGKRSFRLIDFGRSLPRPNNTIGEEAIAGKLLLGDP